MSKHGRKINIVSHGDHASVVNETWNVISPPFSTEIDRVERDDRHE